MRLRDIDVRLVSGDVSGSVGSAAEPALRRAGLVLRLTDSDGNVGLGEASPLPGFSQDSLESCRSSLTRLTPQELDECLSAPESMLARLERARTLLPPASPAAAFALETALLDLVCRREGCSPFALLERPALPRLELNAVLDGTLPDARDRAVALTRRGYSTLKVKFDTRWELALGLLEHLAGRGTLRLRADANRALGGADLERALPRLAALGLEYLEEPCAPESWPSLPPERPRLALDESLRGLAPTALPALVRAAQARVIVLKPMALGGFSECLCWAEQARALGCEVVVTHLFDGPIALRAAQVVALLIESPALAAGLAPHAGLAIWPALPDLEELGTSCEPSSFSLGISPPHYHQVFHA